MACAFLELGLLDPAHRGAEFRADLLDLVLCAFLAEGVENLVATFVFGDPFLGELAGLVRGGFGEP